MKAFLGTLLAFALVISASNARALCIYNGVSDATTTIPQEFRDSKWVVRAKVVAAEDQWSDRSDSWTIYELKVLHAFKGTPPRWLRFFTYRDSGGFYMDRPSSGPLVDHDVGGEYLLFLDPFPASPDAPEAAKGTVIVNYSCGVSGPWRYVRPSELHMLGKLEHSH